MATFEDHGDVTVKYIGFNASAATIIGHGAKKTSFREDGLYLIHKPMVWVDIRGYYNEDELIRAIEDMKTQKKDAENRNIDCSSGLRKKPEYGNQNSHGPAERSPPASRKRSR
jgi:hypothetical protein